MLTRVPADRWDFPLGDSAVPVRAGNNTKCAVFLPALVEMKPNGKHILQKGRWRLNVKHIRLDCPRSEALCFNPFLHRDGHVLMPWHFPVRFRDFVEKNATNGERTRAEHCFDQCRHSRRARKLASFRRQSQEIPYTTAPVYSFILMDSTERLDKPINS
jgi:hypothetical protein